MIQYKTTMDITDPIKKEENQQIKLSNISHDLKSLLTSVKAYGQLLQRKMIKNKDDQSLTYLRKMDKQIDKVVTLLNNLLDSIRKKSNT